GASARRVWYRNGSRSTNTSMHASRAACRIRYGSWTGYPRPITSPIVVPTNVGRANAYPTASRNAARSSWSSGTPSNRASPSSGYHNRPATAASTDLPAPERPTTAIAAPGGTARSTRSNNTRSPDRTVTSHNRRPVRKIGSWPGPYRRIGAANTSAARRQLARARATRVSTDTTPPNPAPSAAYWIAANSSPGVSRPAANPAPPTPTIASCSRGPTTAPRPEARASAIQVRVP